MKFEEAVNYLYSLINYEYKPGYVNFLEPFLKFLDLMGNPHKKVQNPILVVGTKGKGSTSALITAALSDFKTGLYTSPHLVDVRERITVNFKKIPKTRFSRYVEILKPNVRKRGIRTYFELLTTMAFMYFSEEKTQFNVFEAGLGGRLDATNVLDQKITVITPIDLDHTSILGDTVEKIAREKAAVIKNSNPVVTLQYNESALKVIESRCKQTDAPLIVVEKPRIFKTGEEGTEVIIDGKRIYSPLAGKFQASNMALAYHTLKVLGFDNVDFSEVKLRGRFDIKHIEGSKVIVDVAHNEISLRTFFDSYFAIFKDKPYTIFGVSRDKNIGSMIEIIRENSRSVVLTGSSVPRTIDPETLLEIARRHKLNVSGVFNSPCQALQYLLDNHINITIVVIGSFYVAGDLYKCI